MKKIRMIILFASITGICCILSAKEKVSDKTEPDSKDETHQKALKHLTETGQYDSAISYCAAVRAKAGLSYDELEKALATIYWLKGDKNTAYQYVLNSTDYMLKTNAGAHGFPDILYDYEYAYPLATDSFLEKIIINKISEFYSGLHDFPLATSGLKFLLLDHRLRKTITYMSFLSGKNKDTLHYTQLFNHIGDQQENIMREYIDEVKQNGKLLTWKEAGPAFETQFSFLANAGDSALHVDMKPYFEKAYGAKEIWSGLYVDQLTWLAGLEIKDQEKLDQFHDSLCVIYKCAKINQVLRDAHGDTSVFHNNNRFGTPIKE